MYDSTNFDSNSQISTSKGFIRLHDEDFLSTDWRAENGPLPFRLTNDFLVKGILQADETVLRAVISSAMHIDRKQIRSLRILNPYMPGNTIGDKEFILDVHLEMNDSVEVDIEVQVVDYKDWPERSLQYLCRTYNNLSKGDSYKNTKTAIHIGFLDFDLWEEDTPLYTHFSMMERSSHRILTEKFQLYLISLRKTDLATDDDVKWQTDVWAKFFKAHTYEDLKMLAKQDPVIEPAAQAAFELWSDADTRWLIESGEELALLQQGMRDEIRAEKERADSEKERADSEKGRADSLKDKLVHAVEEIADTKSISIPEACDLLSFSYEDYLDAKKQ